MGLVQRISTCCKKFRSFHHPHRFFNLALLADVSCFLSSVIRPRDYSQSMNNGTRSSVELQITALRSERIKTVRVRFEILVSTTTTTNMLETKSESGVCPAVVVSHLHNRRQDGLTSRVPISKSITEEYPAIYRLENYYADSYVRQIRSADK